jgi:hypothetical protein
MGACREWAGSHTSGNTGLSIKHPFDTRGRSLALTDQLQPFRFAPNCDYARALTARTKVDEELGAAAYVLLESLSPPTSP